MTLIHQLTPQAALEPAPRKRSWRPLLALPVAALVMGLLGFPATTTPAPPSEAEVLAAYIDAQSQSLRVAHGINPTVIARDHYGATPGIASLAAAGTNHDWARLVMLLAGYPQTESNITVFTRWMRQENGPHSWWTRNNPLNNGWGSGGGSGLGSYGNLVIAAENAAESLHQNPLYTHIAAGFAASAPPEVIEQAIWASPWASSHYGYGAHWSTAPVPVVRAPADAWG